MRRPSGANKDVIAPRTGKEGDFWLGLGKESVYVRVWGGWGWGYMSYRDLEVTGQLIVCILPYLCEVCEIECDWFYVTFNNLSVISRR